MYILESEQHKLIIYIVDNVLNTMVELQIVNMKINKSAFNVLFVHYIVPLIYILKFKLSRVFACFVIFLNCIK